MILLNRKKIAAVLCTALLGVAGVTNYYHYSNEAKTTSLNLPQANEKYDEKTSYGEAKYVSSDLSKDKSRSEAVALLKTVTADENASQDKKDEAQGEIIRIAQNIEKEAIAKELLTQKGFSEVSVFLNTTGATVSVKSDGLSSEDVAKIRDTMKTDANVLPQNLKIIEIK